MPDMAKVAPTSREEEIRTYYETLYSAWGRQYWWPARTRFEVIVGAYLTQNTSWSNVEIAMRRLRQGHLLSLAAMREVSLSELENRIRSSGYFRQKAPRLKKFVAFVDEHYRGSLRCMFAQPTDKLRQELLALNGVGPETADSILLYAGQHPVFVVDAYTRRVLERHQLVSAKASYDHVRELCEQSLADVQAAALTAESSYAHPPSAMSLARRTPAAQVYNDMHGLIIAVGKHYCRKSEPLCTACPLRPFLPSGE